MDRCRVLSQQPSAVKSADPIVSGSYVPICRNTQRLPGSYICNYLLSDYNLDDVKAGQRACVRDRRYRTGSVSLLAGLQKTGRGRIQNYDFFATIELVR